MFIPSDSTIRISYTERDPVTDKRVQCAMECSQGALIAAINEYLPSDAQKLARHFLGCGPIGVLIFLASDMQAADVIDTQTHPGKVIDL